MNKSELPSNVIKFPVKNKRLPDLDTFKKQMQDAFDNNKIHRGHAEEATELFATIFLEHLAIAGYDVSDPKTFKELALVLEGIKSYLFKYYGVYHPLQIVSEKTFVKKPDGTCFLNISYIKNN